MTDLYLFLPVVPLVAVATAYCYSFMAGSRPRIWRWPLGYFFLVSVGTYAYFYTATHGYPRTSYRDALAVVYTIYAMAFFLLLLFGPYRFRPHFSIPFALLGGVLAIGTAAGSVIVLAVMYFLTGVVKDS